MRKPRDIDAELRALADKAKDLKARKIAQLGELVVATGGDGLEPEVLAGVLLAAVEAKTSDAEAAWRRKGAAFFQRQGGKRQARNQADGGAQHDGAGAS